MVLNAAAGLVVGLGKYEHITPVLRDVLHWLPVPHRIQFKTATLTSEAPGLPTLVTLPAQSLTIQAVLVSARPRAAICWFHEPEQLGSEGRVFFIAPPVVWNSLLLHLRSPSISRSQFRARLKTPLLDLLFTDFSSDNY